MLGSHPPALFHLPPAASHPPPAPLIFLLQPHTFLLLFLSHLPPAASHPPPPTALYPPPTLSHLPPAVSQSRPVFAPAVFQPPHPAVFHPPRPHPPAIITSLTSMYYPYPPPSNTYTPNNIFYNPLAIWP